MLLIGRCVVPGAVRFFVFCLSRLRSFSVSLQLPSATASISTPGTLPQTPPFTRHALILTTPFTSPPVMAAKPTLGPGRKPRPATITAPISVDYLLASLGPNSPTLPPPLEHIGTPTSPTSPSKIISESGHPLPPPAFYSSLADVARDSKRLSLTFPIQPSNAPSARQSPTSRPGSWYNSPLASPELLASPAEPINFLTRLAAQERRVLELKEELRRAEHELEKLKKQWAKEEVSRKKQDVRKLQQLQPLSTTPLALDTLDDNFDGSSEWLQREMERRKALLGGIKSSNRKVFSGSRHTRTLSLLSPERGHFPQPFPQRQNESTSDDAQPLTRLARSSTTPNVALKLDESNEGQEHDDESLPKDVLFKTGKQMMSDMKDGFLTFFEDIRQATVGEEGIRDTAPRISDPATGGRRRTTTRQNGRTPTGKSAARLSQLSNVTKTTPPASLRPDTVSEGEPNPQQANSGDKVETKRLANIAKPRTNGRNPILTPRAPKDLDDAWDTWDTPVSAKHTQSDSDSSLRSGPSASSHAISTPSRSASRQSPSSLPDLMMTPRSSIDTTTAGGRSSADGIPWPALQKLTPTNLRRTASHLMKEWEKNLAPPPTDDSDAASISSRSLAYPAPGSGGKDKRAE